MLQQEMRSISDNYTALQDTYAQTAAETERLKELKIQLEN